MANDKLIEQLNELVSTYSVLYTKLHNYHWYVTGPSFFTLHEKFEELYNEITLNLDEVAERILTKGGKPVATMKEHLELSRVKEATGSENAEEMVQSIIDDFKATMQLIKEAMEEAANQGDDRTEDMLNDTFQSLEKHVWMLSAFLGK
ncbi:Dps family protein [Ureibacillus sp. FSL K6-8385]|uniref:DNA starvation/stationary phase protection protein n=1 Tax=Ureibacillus terrenus TaxID=118246 RepID=A0A540V066_9BACL|nr:Dps family protein [Ureibacillus terrenus]MED3662556.1 DNA starvation/stationary phase protection protein [Ureibacillus terrenus]MED3764861.1 DNA starvation/stationary phase protection protein [Ureibacillus terrenus]TQE90159.1 DNA starvation/stationary phase protection protein [Ureibacillus terrenus]